MKYKVTIYLAGAALVAFLAQSATVTQSSVGKGTLHGIVTDPSGAVIPRASVIVLSGYRFVQTAATDDTGEYVAAGLLPGHYRVRIRSAGFNTVEKSGLVLAAGYETEADAQLSIRATRQEITVTAGPTD